MLVKVPVLLSDRVGAQEGILGSIRKSLKEEKRRSEENFSKRMSAMSYWNEDINRAIYDHMSRVNALGPELSGH